ncbi:polysaccharide pyruvyl transferase family protein [Microbulbifer litoralis]|uniref:polysaccharide pyruvyl transferase family protein n=1 Tax=Microbulbifer litoralis TaxID=2933965 RepID=UPI0020283586|nr:polysaccharide pyruvyl transferase family protein [Microbulbifer sp. GX H0434]
MIDELKAFVRTENIFPAHDKMWLQAKSFVDGLGITGRILAPFEFSEYYPELEPVQFSYFKNVDEYEVVVLNKAQIDRYDDSFVDSVQDSFVYAFGNSVFNVYVKDGVTSCPDLNHKYRRLSVEHVIKRAVKYQRGFPLLHKIKSKLTNKTPTILVVSASKFGNAGDDAITESAVKILEKSFKGAYIRLARPPFRRCDVDGADIVALGGGGVLYDSCFNNAMNYCDYLFYAKSRGKRTLGIGLGTQGIKSARGREMYRHALGGCELLVVRNKRDEEVLVEDCGVETEVCTTNDIVFSFGKKFSKQKLGKPRKRLRVAVSLLDSKNLLAANAMKRYREGCNESIDFLCKKHDVCFVVQSKDDLELYDKYVSEYGAKVITYDYGNTRKFIDFYKTVDLSVTSRFHGYIFSLLAGVPVISVGSNAGKIDRLIKAAIPSGKFGYIPLRDFSIDSFHQVFNVFMESPEQYIPLQAEVAEAVKSAQSTVNHVKRTFS